MVYVLSGSKKGPSPHASPGSLAATFTLLQLAPQLKDSSDRPCRSGGKGLPSLRLLASLPNGQAEEHCSLLQAKTAAAALQVERPYFDLLDAWRTRDWS